MRATWVSLAVAGALAAAAPAADAQQSCINRGFNSDRDGVYLYEHTDHRGRCTRFTADARSLRGTAVGANEASSIRIVGDFSATLYSVPGFRGTETTFHGDDRNFVDVPIGNDRTESIQVTRQGRCRRGGAVVLFQHSNCRGLALTLEGDVPNLHFEDVPRNEASSLAAPDDYAVTVYDRPDYRGTSTTYRGRDDSFGDDAIGHDHTESVQVRRSRCDDAPGVYVYARTNHRGDCSRLRGDVPNLTPEYVGNDSASSIRIIGPYVVTAFRHAGYRGESSRFLTDRTTFDGTVIGHDRASSLRIQQVHNVCSQFARPGVYLYSGRNFTGDCARLTDDTGNLARHLVGADAASSIRLVGGYAARLYDQTGISGEPSSRFSADDPDLSDDAIGEDTASSVDVIAPDPAVRPNPEKEHIWRLQVRLVTADVDGAGTKDDVVVGLNPENHTWIDYGVLGDFRGDDFARGSGFTYDLNLDRVERFNDIDAITIAKTGGDGWCLSRIELIVNNVAAPVYGRVFGPCLRLDESAPAGRSFDITFDDLRGRADWNGYERPGLLEVAHIPAVELMSRIHGIVGHSLRGTDGFWGELQGRESVEVDDGGDQTVSVDLDLAGKKLGFTAEVDVNFDLRFSCRVNDEGEAVFGLRANNFDVDSDFDGLAKLLLFAFEGRIDRKIEDVLPTVNRSIQVAGLRFCPRITVNDDGSVSFGL